MQATTYHMGLTERTFFIVEPHIGIPVPVLLMLAVFLVQNNTTLIPAGMPEPPAFHLDAWLDFEYDFCPL